MMRGVQRDMQKLSGTNDHQMKNQFEQGLDAGRKRDDLDKEIGRVETRLHDERAGLRRERFTVSAGP